MNLSYIKTVIEKKGVPNEIKEDLILKELAESPKSIPFMLKMLEYERVQQKELLLDTNLELSKALLCIVKPKTMKKDWAIEQIKNHYKKWAHKIRCCFKFNDLP